MNKGTYILFHALFIVLMLALGIAGLFLLEAILYGIGALIILLGLLIFFTGTHFQFVFDEFGNEWMVTNIQYRAIILAVTVVIGAAIAILPTFFAVPQVIVSIAMVLLGFGVGFRLHGENNSYRYYVGDGARLLGSLVPIVYMLNAGFFMIAALFELHFIFGILSTVLCLVPHVFRMIAVYRDSV